MALDAPRTADTRTLPSAYKLYDADATTPEIYLIGNIHGLRHMPGIIQTPYDTAKLEIVSTHFIQSIQPEWMIFEGTAHVYNAMNMPAENYNALYKRDSESYLAEEALRIGSKFQFLECTDYHKSLPLHCIDFYGLRLSPKSYQRVMLQYPNLGFVIALSIKIVLSLLQVVFSFFIIDTVFTRSSAEILRQGWMKGIGTLFFNYMIAKRLAAAKQKTTQKILNLQYRTNSLRVASFFEHLKTTPLDPNEKIIIDRELSLTVRNQDWVDKIQYFIKNNTLSNPLTKSFFSSQFLKLEAKLKAIFKGSEHPLPVLPGDTEKLAEHRKVVQHLRQTCNLAVEPLPACSKRAVIFTVGLGHIQGLVEELQSRGIEPEPVDLFPSRLLEQVNHQIQILKSSALTG